MASMASNILTRVKDVPKAWKVARLWNKALDKASDGKYREALAFLKSIYDISKAEMPSANVPYFVNMLCGQITSRTGDYDLCVEAMMTALRQLSRKDIKGLSQFDKDYLRYYCKVALEYCFSKGKSVRVSTDLLNPGLVYDSLQVEKVKTHLKIKFPISPPDPT